MRHPNRISRSKAQRMLKTAKRGQLSHRSRHVGIEGLWCRICSPTPWGKMDKRTAADRAAAEDMDGR